MSERPWIAFLILGAVVIVTNLAMYSLVRGAIRSDWRWLRGLRDTLAKPLAAGRRPMDELRQRIEDLQIGDKDDP